MGGAGKTELVRQLLARIHGARWDRVAFVQFEHTPANSWMRAFPEFQNTLPENLEHRARALLEDSDGGHSLLLIDNYDDSTGQAWLDGLLSWRCDIIVTTRLSVSADWHPIPLKGLDSASASGLFECYDPPAARERADVKALCDSFDGHPLAVRLLAGLCRARYWTVRQLTRHIHEQGIAELSYIQQARIVRVAQVLSGVFAVSELTRDQRLLLRLLALLPYAYRSPDSLLRYAADITADRDYLADQCRVLADLNWLQANETAFPSILCFQKPCCWIHYPRMSFLLCGRHSLPPTTRSAAAICFAPHSAPIHGMRLAFGPFPKWPFPPDARRIFFCRTAYLKNSAGCWSHPSKKGITGWRWVSGIFCSWAGMTVYPKTWSSCQLSVKC